MSETENCPHGRLTTAYCDPCAEEQATLDRECRAGNSDAFNAETDRLLAMDEKPARKIDQKVVQPHHHESFCDGWNGEPCNCHRSAALNDAPSGLDAPYYDFPDHINTAMDLIEWLGLNFSQGNQLKSLIRENNPHGTKKTTALYEAEKRSYYASRDLRRVQALQGTVQGGE